MTENGFKNNFLNNIIECPRCHIKLSKKEMQLHNIKCRMVNNQKEKDKDIQKEEYKKKYEDNRVMSMSYSTHI